ncbi:MAG TPA: helix-turn-helix domain-containing protein [Syntrophorhabdaceae bacterium]|nr:helix-turn-helix domain-containing protein [Syntrophorhabdaceae bacterium]
MKIGRRSLCPISSALDLMGDKWTLLIIRDLLFLQKNTFKEFALSDEKIATNILSDRLSRLETLGIVSKTPDPQNKTINVYRLTQKGIDLMPILFEIVLWSDKYMKISTRGHLLAERIRNNRAGLLERLSTALSQANALDRAEKVRGGKRTKR